MSQLCRWEDGARKAQVKLQPFPDHVSLAESRIIEETTAEEGLELGHDRSFLINPNSTFLPLIFTLCSSLKNSKNRKGEYIFNLQPCFMPYLRAKYPRSEFLDYCLFMFPPN